MEALRKIYTVENHRVTIDLPKSFKHDAVEIIILPVDSPRQSKTAKNKTTDKPKALTELLNIGVWTEKDILPILESQNLINRWKIEKF